MTPAGRYNASGRLSISKIVVDRFSALRYFCYKLKQLIYHGVCFVPFEIDMHSACAD